MADGSGIGSVLRYAAVALQVLIVVVMAYAAVLGQVGLVLNSVFALALASIPRAVRYRYDHRLNPVLALLIVAAAAFHAVGALGGYESVPGFDRVAHAVSGALVAGTGYALVQVIDRRHDGIVIPPRLRFVFIIVFTLAVGVVWELAEFAAELAAEFYGGESLLTQYGLDDTVLDLVFDGIGALVVGLWGTSYFDELRLFIDGWAGDPASESSDD